MATEGYIRYRSDYKHQLAFDYVMAIPIKPKTPIATEFIVLDTGGHLEVKAGYAWDGTSGPIADTPENLRASLVHDALYQLMRNSYLNARTYRRPADELFRDMCKQDGVPSRTANVYYEALRKFGKPAADPGNKKKIHRSPAAPNAPEPKRQPSPARKKNTTRARRRK